MHGPVKVCALVVVFFLGTTAATAQDGPASRLTPTVKAVQKVKPSVVAIKVPSANGKDTTGSGVIIDERGFIITNRHVVGPAKNVKVLLVDKTEYAAKVLVADLHTDLAVLKIEAGKKL